MVFRPEGIQARSRIRVRIRGRARRQSLSSPLQNHGGRAAKENCLYLALQRRTGRFVGDIRIVPRKRENTTEADPHWHRNFPEDSGLRAEKVRGRMDRDHWFRAQAVCGRESMMANEIEQRKKVNY